AQNQETRAALVGAAAGAAGMDESTQQALAQTAASDTVGNMTGAALSGDIRAVGSIAQQSAQQAAQNPAMMDMAIKQAAVQAGIPEEQVDAALVNMDPAQKQQFQQALLRGDLNTVYGMMQQGAQQAAQNQETRAALVGAAAGAAGMDESTQQALAQTAASDTVGNMTGAALSGDIRAVGSIAKQSAQQVAQNPAMMDMAIKQAAIKMGMPEEQVDAALQNMDPAQKQQFQQALLRGDIHASYGLMLKAVQQVTVAQVAPQVDASLLEANAQPSEQTFGQDSDTWNASESSIPQDGMPQVSVSDFNAQRAPNQMMQAAPQVVPQAGFGQLPSVPLQSVTSPMRQGVLPQQGLLPAHPQMGQGVAVVQQQQPVWQGGIASPQVVVPKAQQFSAPLAVPNQQIPTQVQQAPLQATDPQELFASEGADFIEDNSQGASDAENSGFFDPRQMSPNDLFSGGN
ncbi:MAG: hypothetical protein Q8K36_04130, partial [Alphaproteobacteria bacterium]|nr:hypothetical protein [Alphaproteobacteria bacterium]